MAAFAEIHQSRQKSTAALRTRCPRFLILVVPRAETLEEMKFRHRPASEIPKYNCQIPPWSEMFFPLVCSYRIV